MYPLRAVPETSRRVRWLRSRVAVSLGIGLALFAIVMGAREVGWLASWEIGAYDNYLRLRPPSETPVPVTLVLIEESDYKRFGHPLPDGVFAEALEKLGGQQPRAIGIDVYRDVAVGEGRDELAMMFNLYPQIVIVEKLADPVLPAVAPPEFLADRRQVGLADVPTDDDGIVRRGLLYAGDESGMVYQSFPFKLAALYLYLKGITITEDPDAPGVTRFGETSLPAFEPDFGGYKHEDAGGYQYLIDYRRPIEEIPRLRFDAVHDGAFDTSLVKDRVVMIGTSAPSVKDFFFAPTGFFQSEGKQVVGVGHHAQAVDQLIRYGEGVDAPVRVLSENAERAWILLWCLAGALIGLVTASLLRLSLAVVVGLGVLLGGCYAVFLADLWLPVVPAAMGSLGSVALVVGYLTQQERADRARALSLFGKFVSHSLVEELWDKRQQFMAGDRPLPQRAEVTLLMSDLFGYTTLSEKGDPADVLAWLGAYTDRMAQLVDDYGGMVNDFLGDGLMATFGAPIPRQDDEGVAQDAVAAVECALAMEKALEELNAGWREDGLPTARLRVGILTGAAAIGTIGSEEHLKYATVGNTVNTAARLETFDKGSFEEEDTTCRILVGQATLDRLGDRFETSCLGDHVLKGKGEAVTIYRVWRYAAGEASD